MTIKKLFFLFCLFICSFSLLVFLNQSLPISPARATDLSEIFKDTEAAFVLTDLKNNKFLSHNEERCRQRVSPLSTFKIPNSLIGLETGVIKDADFIIPWDREKYPPEEFLSETWRGDQTLRSALKNSVIWYYKELALKVGEQAMKTYLAKFQYGNEDIAGGIDKFWLSSSLQISPNEQVEFLKKFYTGTLPISNRSTEIVKDILVLEKTDSYKLSAKTGAGPIENGKYLGWYVGYLEKNDNVYFFATNVEGDSFASIRDKRIELTKKVFTKLGLM